MSPERRVRLLMLAFWVVPALVGTLGFQLVPSRLNPTLSLGALLLAQLAIWGAWSVWSMLIWWVGERVPFDRGNMLRALAVHIPLGVLVIVVQILVQSELAIAFGIGERRGLESTIVIGVRSYGDTFVVLFCAIVGAQVAFRWYTNWQAQRVIAARMGEDLAQAQLRALQAQLNPHFLFNALNSVVTLIGRDPVLAQRTVVRLADLLRATLRAGDTQEVALAQEIELTRRYLDIELVRFADRLTVRWYVPDDLNAVVPAFALQPLVENALVHGIARLSGAGILSISAAHEGTDIVLRVCDNGLGPTVPSTSQGAGVGLANLRARLVRLYGDAASLTLQARDGGGAESVLRVPFRPVLAVVAA
ncbi:MAG: histidine kinase [Gemmatimonadaceae bacterium]|nr:histidine kinase [Gemmatimonadaceae bacterium]